MPKFELISRHDRPAVIKVIGVGGGGSNAVDYMYKSSVHGVEFVCANTDMQALANSDVPTQLQLGSSITKGLGAGAVPETGRKAALEDREALLDVLDGADMVFLTAGMGGGTGTGATPVIAQAAREKGILTVAVVTRPFDNEGSRRAQYAEEGISELTQYVDSLIIIPNEKLLTVLDANITLLDAFAAANEVLLNAVRGIAELITETGHINVDFADVRTVMSQTGMAMMGSGTAAGEGRAVQAAETALSSPLLEDINLVGAKGMLINITCGPDFMLREHQEVGALVKRYASEDAINVCGVVSSQGMSDEMRVTVVATGLSEPRRVQQQASTQAAVQRSAEQEAPESRSVPAAKAAASDYREFDRPAVLRNPNPPQQEKPESDPAVFNVPAFLRRQAD